MVWWAALGAFHSEIIGLAFALLSTAILYWFRPRVKLIYGRANNSRNLIRVPSSDEETENGDTVTEIYVEKFFLQNTGRKTATNVEFVLSDFPSDISVWQPRNVTYTRVQRENCLAGIPQIAPRELVVIDCVYINQKAAWITSVKSAEALGKEVPFCTVRQFPQWVILLILITLLMGIAFAFQLLVALF